MRLSWLVLVTVLLGCNRPPPAILSRTGNVVNVQYIPGEAGSRSTVVLFEDGGRLVLRYRHIGISNGKQTIVYNDRGEFVRIESTPK